MFKCVEFADFRLQLEGGSIGWLQDGSLECGGGELGVTEGELAPSEANKCFCTCLIFILECSCLATICKCRPEAFEGRVGGRTISEMGQLRGFHLYDAYEWG